MSVGTNDYSSLHTSVFKFYDWFFYKFLKY